MAGLADALAARSDGNQSATFRATVRAVDYDARRLEVEVGDDTMILPYVGNADYFQPGDTVLAVKEATGPIVLGALGGALDITEDAAEGPSAAPSNLALSRIAARVFATCDTYASATAYRWRASTNGGTTWAPTVTTTDPTTTFGIGQGQTLTVQVAAYVSSAWTLWTSSVAVTYPLPESDYETATVTIQPSDSATYRAGKGWDRYNGDRWDGFRAVYQGNAYGSGVLTGWAGYGDRIENLRAVEITRVVLKAKRNAWTNENTPAALQVQGSTSGTQPAGAPTGIGATATTTSVRLNKWAWCELPESMCEALRTGGIKGLVAVGTDASGWYGTSGSMALEITYRRRV